MYHDGQRMAYGPTSAAEITLTNRSAIAAYEGLAAAELFGGFIDAPHLQSKRSAQGMVNFLDKGQRTPCGNLLVHGWRKARGS
jgi:hypothetical protein